MTTLFLSRRIVRNIASAFKSSHCFFKPGLTLWPRARRLKFRAVLRPQRLKSRGGGQTVDQCSGPLGAHAQVESGRRDGGPPPPLRAGRAGRFWAVTIATEKLSAEAWSSMQPIPPELPNEFQRFVASSIGEGWFRRFFIESIRPLLRLSRIGFRVKMRTTSSVLETIFLRAWTRNWTCGCRCCNKLAIRCLGHGVQAASGISEMYLFPFLDFSII